LPPVDGVGNASVQRRKGRSVLDGSIRGKCAVFAGNKQLVFVVPFRDNPDERAHDRRISGAETRSECCQLDWDGVEGCGEAELAVFINNRCQFWQNA